MRGQLKAATCAIAIMCAGVGGAHAGGLERTGYNIDLLFDPGPFVMGTTAIYVSPQRDLKHTVDSDFSDGTGGPDTSTRESSDYVAAIGGVKINVVPAIDCLFQYSQPWGAHSNPGTNWAGANSNIETKVESDNLGATCSYKFDTGPGDLRFIAGGFHQKVDGFKDRLVAPVPLFAPGAGTGIGHLSLSGEGYGWRVGLAYEVPEIAFRTSLVYNSAVDLNDITGTLDLTQIPAGFLGSTNPLLGLATPVEGSATMPQSVELKAQTGIAPDWLAFGSVKWVNWSVLQTIPFYAAGIPGPATSLNLLYRDGWTATAGVGHRFSDRLNAALGVTWDHGVSHGYGSLTDTWTINAGVIFTPTPMMEFRVGGAAGVLTAGSSDVLTGAGGKVIDAVSYDFDNDFVGALSVSARVKF